MTKAPATNHTGGNILDVGLAARSPRPLYPCDRFDCRGGVPVTCAGGGRSGRRPGRKGGDRVPVFPLWRSPCAPRGVAGSEPMATSLGRIALHVWSVSAARPGRTDAGSIPFALSHMVGVALPVHPAV